MINRTLMIVGPGGIGKSPLEGIIKTEAIRIDPYRLRSDGPRIPNKAGEKDLFYAHPKLRDEIYLTFQRIGIGLTCLSADVHWFSQAMTLFLKVRTDWQVLFLEGLDADIAKTELYAPAVPVILGNPQTKRVFGKVSVVFLNPTDKLSTLSSLTPLEEATRKNCRKREGLGKDEDDTKTVKKRVASIKEEAEAWLKMVELGATEYTNWKFPEYIYTTSDKTVKLIEARQVLLTGNPELNAFLKTEDEIACPTCGR